MRFTTTIAEVRAWRRETLGAVGLVPTMGCLHAGHLSLVEAARRESDRVTATIFVNPTQFGPNEDFARYPRSLEQDCRLLDEAGCDLVFAPSAAEMYPDGSATTVGPGPVAEPLEGARRPGHFRGVATVVLKLLQIVAPQRAYFGEKDAQQLAVIRRLVADINLAVEVRACPTVREPDGLALSSRNVYLSPEERQAALVLSRALATAERWWVDGERQGAALVAAMRGVFAQEPLARLDYASAADPLTFREVEQASGPLLLLVAAWLGQTRLIDNRRLE